ncbi:MAG TPA: 6-phosphogluconolactonase [Candidatus Binataceae bacterium]|nr:6-phosphogluconolactonase [Candidatus Binataceae bacterium]
MSEPKIIVLDDEQALHMRAAEEIAHLSGEAICTHAEFTFCLSGGSTPAAVYELLGSRFLLSVDWNEVHFFWGDERCVPPDDPMSNYAMTQRTMLSKLPIKPSQVHRIRGEEPPAAAAQAYEVEIASHFGGAGFPHFDLTLMGLGDNSHTASLFPHNPALHEAERVALAVEVDDPTQRHRVTLTAPVFNNAANVIFLVSGAGKAQAVWNILKGPHNPDEFPAQLIAPAKGELIWLLDRAAASKIS